MEIKSSSFKPHWQAPGEFTGYASVFDFMDYDRDLVCRGAFCQSLARWNKALKTPLLLWQHNARSPIGYCVKLEETSYGLKVHGRLLLSTQKGRTAFQAVQKTNIKGLSIGFITKKSSFDPLNKIRFLKEIDLREISLVKTPANPLAFIENIVEKGT